MKNPLQPLALLTVLASAAASSSASAQTDPCTAWTNAPRPSFCFQQPASAVRPAPVPVRAAPVYSRPVGYPAPAPQWNSDQWHSNPWNSDQWATQGSVSVTIDAADSAPMYAPMYAAPAPALVQPAPQWASQYGDWDGERVDVYINGRPVMTNVTRRDVARLRLNHSGRYEFRVVPAGYQYSQPLYINSYDAPQSGLSLSLSFGGTFNLIFR